MYLARSRPRPAFRPLLSFIALRLLSSRARGRSGPVARRLRECEHEHEFVILWLRHSHCSLLFLPRRSLAKEERFNALTPSTFNPSTLQRFNASTINNASPARSDRNLFPRILFADRFPLPLLAVLAVATTERLRQFRRQ
jgi:hypothetical protein